LQCLREQVCENVQNDGETRTTHCDNALAHTALSVQ
jgi:hypothetical protein